MKKTILIALVFISGMANAQNSVEWIPFIQQSGVYYISDRVTIGGLGIGVGVTSVVNRNLILQTDTNILWLNGNANSTRLALGYQREGQWSPAIMTTVNVLWGQRTEVLSETGERPSVPVVAVGIRGAPLRFNGSLGYVSALELGFGLGPDNGISLELMILGAGIRW